MPDTPSENKKLRLHNTDTNRFKVETGRFKIQNETTEETAQKKITPAASATQKAINLNDPISLRDTSTGKLRKITSTGQTASTFTPGKIEKRSETVRLKVIRKNPEQESSDSSPLTGDVHSISLTPDTNKPQPQPKHTLNLSASKPPQPPPPGVRLAGVQPAVVTPTENSIKSDNKLKLKNQESEQPKQPAFKTISVPPPTPSAQKTMVVPPPPPTSSSPVTSTAPAAHLKPTIDTSTIKLNIKNLAIKNTEQDSSTKTNVDTPKPEILSPLKSQKNTTDTIAAKKMDLTSTTSISTAHIKEYAKKSSTATISLKPKDAKAADSKEEDAFSKKINLKIKKTSDNAPQQASPVAESKNHGSGATQAVPPPEPAEKDHSSNHSETQAINPPEDFKKPKLTISKKKAKETVSVPPPENKKLKKKKKEKADTSIPGIATPSDAKKIGALESISALVAALAIGTTITSYVLSFLSQM